MAWGSISLFAAFLEKEKLFGNFDCDIRQSFTKAIFLTEYEGFGNSVLTANSRYLQTAALNILNSGDEFTNLKILPL